MTHPLVQKVRRRLREHADPVRGRSMQAYMKSAMPCLGVSTPVQRTLWRELFKAHPLDSFDEWRTAVLTLWREAECREERYAAIALAEWRTYRPFRTRRALPMIEEMIVSGAWWDFVDVLATHHLADVLLAEQSLGQSTRMKRQLLVWARGENLWKRRAAILAQLRFKRDTDTAFLFACIEPSLLDVTEKKARDIRHDFFIRKAIGWALRQYARVAPDEVKRYLRTNRTRLSPLSVREAEKHL